MKSIDSGTGDFLQSFITSSLMITLSEIGDKTFFITSILAVKNSRWIVFLGSMCGLAANSIISIFLGVLTAKLSTTTKIIHHFSVTLFLVFGIRMIIEGLRMSNDQMLDDDYDRLDEYREAKRAVQENEDQKNTKNAGIKKFFSKKMLVFMQVFTIIFFAEIGDKAQLSAIMLATRENIYGVVLGSFVGFLISNALAVLAFRAILTRISVKKVILCGGFVFIFCALLHAYY